MTHNMENQNKTNTIIKFPTATELPKEFSTDLILEQKHYLVNGTLKEWKGLTENVFSPVCINNDGQIKRFRL